MNFHGWRSTACRTPSHPSVLERTFIRGTSSGMYPTGAATGDMLSTGTPVPSNASTYLSSNFGGATAMNLATSITAQPTGSSTVSDVSDRAVGAPSAASTTDAFTPPTPSSWEYCPCPDTPIVSQPNLGLLNGGVITGYLLNHKVTAVLPISSFHVNREAILTFTKTVERFIEKTKVGGYTRIMIDVQKDGGGGGLLATDAFRQFFLALILSKVADSELPRQLMPSEIFLRHFTTGTQRMIFGPSRIMSTPILEEISALRPSTSVHTLATTIYSLPHRATITLVFSLVR